MTKDIPQSGMELLIYQISEVQKGVSTMSAKQDAFQDKIDSRVTSLEQYRAISEAQAHSKTKNEGMLFGWVGENALAKIAILALTLALAVMTYVTQTGGPK